MCSAVRQQALDESCVTRGQEGACTQLTLTLARLLGQDVSPVRPVVLDLSTLGHLEALLRSSARFHLGHFPDPSVVAATQLRIQIKRRPPKLASVSFGRHGRD